MTTISTLNIVMQQEGSARETQNARNTATDKQNHLVSADQKEKEVQQQTTVQQSNQSERIRADKDPKDKRERKRKNRRSSNGAAGASEPKRRLRQAGKLVDTVA